MVGHAMTETPRAHALHLVCVASIAAVLALLTVYPFLPGRHDPLAASLSIGAQVFGVIGWLLVPIGTCWLALPRYAFGWALIGITVGVLIALVLSLFATLSSGMALGVLTLGACTYALARLGRGAWRLRRAETSVRHPASLYLLLLPVLTFLVQWTLGTPLTRWSRDRAIVNAAPLIADIEQYRVAHGRYPASLEAQHKDYQPGVVGVERYAYLPRGDTYNVSFETPRFMLDRFGTREWVVYNPRDEHRVYSHAAWLMPPSGVTEPGQGWYASGETGHAHWRYFWFD
jgi:hypothetical protein